MASRVPSNATSRDHPCAYCHRRTHRPERSTHRFCPHPWANAVENHRGTWANLGASDAFQSTASERKRRGRFQQGRVWDSTIRLGATQRCLFLSNTYGDSAEVELPWEGLLDQRHRPANPVSSKLASPRQSSQCLCNAEIGASLDFRRETPYALEPDGLLSFLASTRTIFR